MEVALAVFYSAKQRRSQLFIELESDQGDGRDRRQP